MKCGLEDIGARRHITHRTKLASVCSSFCLPVICFMNLAHFPGNNLLPPEVSERPCIAFSSFSLPQGSLALDFLRQLVSYGSAGLVEFLPARPGPESRMGERKPPQITPPQPILQGAGGLNPCARPRPCPSLGGKLRNSVLFPGEQNNGTASARNFPTNELSVHRRGWQRAADAPLMGLAP